MWSLCTSLAESSFRMSYVYKLWSSLAKVKLNGSRGFQATALLFIASTNLRIGVSARMS